VFALFVIVNVVNRVKKVFMVDGQPIEKEVRAFSAFASGKK
jgi:hypothetical protein